MEIMGKCPFWGEPCLKEECSSFEYHNVRLWSSKDRRDYRAFKQEQRWDDDDSVNYWWALEIPFCRVLDKELPMRKSTKFLEVQV